VNVIPLGQQLGRAIGRAIIDHQDLAAIRERPRDGRRHMLDLVIYRQSGKRLQRHITIVPRENVVGRRRSNGGRGKAEGGIR
jgi:hypothetical protein